MASSNIDASGLKSIYSESQKISQIFLDALGIVSRITTPTGASGGYKQAIGNSLLTCSESAINMNKEIKRYINDMEKANLSVTETVDSFGEGSGWFVPPLLENKENDELNKTSNEEMKESQERENEKEGTEEKGGFWSGVVDFFGKVIDANRTANAYSTQADLNLTANVAEFIGADAVAENARSAGDSIVSDAQKAAEEKTGAKVAGSFFNLTVGAGREAGLKIGEGIWDGARMLGNQMLEAQLMNDAYGLAGTLNSNVRDSNLKLAEDVRNARSELMEDVEHDYTRDNMNEWYSQGDAKEINDVARIKYGSGEYMIATGIYQSIGTELMATIPGVGLGLKYLSVSGNVEEDTLNRMKLDSKKGIREEYEAGNVSESDYVYYKYIWNMSDEEFHELRAKKVTGEISDEEYDKAVHIRNMQDEWQTQENFYGANAVGAAVGAIETAQTVVGKATNVIEGAAGMAMRAGTDLQFSAIEQPVKNMITADIMETTMKEEFERDGGVKGYFTNLAIEFAGSAVGELFDLGSSRLKKGNADGVDISTKTDVDVDVKKTSTTDRKILTEEYLLDLEKYQAEGVSFEEFLYNNGVSTINNKTKLDVAETMGDSKLYMLETATNNFLSNPNMSAESKARLKDVISKYSGIRVGNIDSKDMLTDMADYLTFEQVEHAVKLIKSGLTEQMTQAYTEAQRASVFNYTACGGFEINAWLNDINLGNTGIRARDRFETLGDIQDFISGWKKIETGEVVNRIFTSEQGDMIESLDSLITSASYNDAIVTYRGVKSLYDGNVQINPEDLRVGDSFLSAGYQSSSIVRDRCYGITKNDHNIILEVVVPPNSGTAAYIENITGVRNYGQMEMLIKRDAKMTVVGDVEYIDVNGITKAVIPVVVQ